MAGHGRGRQRDISGQLYWPGFVDAMSQLLLVFIFLLTLFAVAQFMQARELTGQDTALDKLRAQVAELSELLALEKASKAKLEATLASLSAALEEQKGKAASLAAMLQDLQAGKGEAGGVIANLRAKLDKERQISAEALAQVELLNQQIAALRRQIACSPCLRWRSSCRRAS